MKIGEDHDRRLGETLSAGTQSVFKAQGLPTIASSPRVQEAFLFQAQRQELEKLGFNAWFRIQGGTASGLSSFASLDTTIEIVLRWAQSDPNPASLPI